VTTLTAKIYSSVMDVDTCDACAKLDGAVFDIEDYRLTLPNPKCTCKRGCLCCWIYNTDRESESAVKPTKDFR
jgi:hypothetical protein